MHHLHSFPTRRSSDLSMLRGEEIDAEIDERSGYELRESLWKQPPPVVYNPNVPIETFDFIITDERSEEHTSELQSLRHLVCRLLLEKKNNNHILYVMN